MITLTIGFSRSTGKLAIFSWLIMLFQKTNYSHAYLRFNLESINKEIVFQASGLSVNFMGITLFKQKETIVKEFQLEITNSTFNNIMKIAIDKLGQPYSLLQILNSAIYLICKKNLFNNMITGWDCSKLVAYTLEKELGLIIPDNLDVITPKNLYDFLEKKYGDS